MSSVSVSASKVLPDFGASCQTVLASITSCDLPTGPLLDLAVKATGLGLKNLVEGATDFMVNAIVMSVNFVDLYRDSLDSGLRVSTDRGNYERAKDSPSHFDGPSVPRLFARAFVCMPCVIFFTSEAMASYTIN